MKRQRGKLPLGSMGKGALAFCMAAVMAVPAVSMNIQKVSGSMETSFSVPVSEATDEAVRIEERAIAKYDFESNKGIADMNNPKYNLSEIKEVTGCSSVLVMGEPQKLKSFGVELENPYAGHDEYVESLTDALRNNGVIYNGRIDEGVQIWGNPDGTTFAALDVEAMPLEGKTYPFPKWTIGFTMSTWVRVPENINLKSKEEKDNPVLFTFARITRSGKGNGGLCVKLNGTTIFAEGDGGGGRNSYQFQHNFDGTDPLAMAGKWVQVTLTIENDWLEIYFNGVKATGKTVSSNRNGATQSKMFNHGWGYRDPEYTGYYKNYRDMLLNFSEEEKEKGDFSDFGKYNFLNSDGESIIELLTDPNAKLYVGGDNQACLWGLVGYTNTVEGMMVDDMLFFDEVLSDEEIAMLYAQSDKKSDDFTEPEPVNSATPSEEPGKEPADSGEPSKEPVDSEEPSDEPVDSEEPSKDPVTSQGSAETSASPVPSPQISEKPKIKGDVDGNGVLEIKDAQRALKAALNLIRLSKEEEEAADVDGNHKVELSDAQKILRAALNLINL